MLLSGKAVLNSAIVCMIHLTIKMHQVAQKNCIVQHILQQLSHIFSVADIGQFQKISIPYHGRFPYFNSPPAFGISKMRYSPMPSDFHNRKPPLPFRFSFFLSNPSELPAGFANMPNLAYFTEIYFK